MSNHWHCMSSNYTLEWIWVYMIVTSVIRIYKVSSIHKPGILFKFFSPGRMAKKRVGTLKNVISNLKRFRDMDVTTSESNDAKKSSSDEVTEKSTSEVYSTFPSTCSTYSRV